jgi:hypothetical protein
MEFLVLTSRYIKQRERERVVMQAVIEAAETAGIDRIEMRRGNVYSTGVYVNDGKGKSLLYNDWEKNWNRKKIYDSIMASIRFSPVLNQKHQLMLTVS